MRSACSRVQEPRTSTAEASLNCSESILGWGSTWLLWYRRFRFVRWMLNPDYVHSLHAFEAYQMRVGIWECIFMDGHGVGSRYQYVREGAWSGTEEKRADDVSYGTRFAVHSVVSSFIYIIVQRWTQRGRVMGASCWRVAQIWTRGSEINLFYSSMIFCDQIEDERFGAKSSWSIVGLVKIRWREW